MVTLTGKSRAPSPSPSIFEKVIAEVEQAIVGHSIAIMIYGSQARGSATDASDVDVLQLVERGAGSYKKGRVSITAYTPSHMHQMAERGSLFVLHLRTEGIVLSDLSGVLSRALAAYRAPRSYEPLYGELHSAARAFLVSNQEFDEHGQAMGRLGIYLLRTSLYLNAVAVGTPTFDVDEVARTFGDRPISEVLNSRRAEVLSSAQMVAIRSAVRRHFQVDGQLTSLASLAVGLARSHPHASALVAQTLTAGNSLDYAGFPLPPL